MYVLQMLLWILPEKKWLRKPESCSFHTNSKISYVTPPWIAAIELQNHRKPFQGALLECKSDLLKKAFPCKLSPAVNQKSHCFASAALSCQLSRQERGVTGRKHDFLVTLTVGLSYQSISWYDGSNSIFRNEPLPQEMCDWNPKEEFTTEKAKVEFIQTK